MKVLIAPQVAHRLGRGLEQRGVIHAANDVRYRYVIDTATI